MAWYTEWFRKSSSNDDKAGLVYERALKDALQFHMESSFGVPVLEDDDEEDWNRMTRDELTKLTEAFRFRDKIRELTLTQPHIKRALALYEQYVFGCDFSVCLKRKDQDEEVDEKLLKSADAAWKQFQEANAKWWTPVEMGRRTWRDGEQFTRLFPGESPLKVRFVDPENIKDENANEQDGIVTDPIDVAEVEKYWLYDLVAGRVVGSVPPEEMLHTKIDSDSTEKRGRSRFLSVIYTAKMLEEFVRTEVIHRRLQASIVLVRTVQGGRSAAQLLLDNAKTSTTNYPEQSIPREKIRPGNIYTNTAGVDLEFKSPDSNFDDASGLENMLVRHIATACGWTYSMLAGDPGDANFGASLVAESPVLQMIEAERNTFVPDIRTLFWNVLSASEEITQDVETIQKDYEIDIRWPNVLSRDQLKEAQAVNLGVMNGTLSVKEGSRRMDADPDQMRAERKLEIEAGLVPSQLANQNPDMADKSASSQSNANQGGGTNQDQGRTPTGNDDAIT